MILDKNLLVSDEQSLTSTGAVSTDSIDLGADVNLGLGEQMAAVVILDVVATDGNGNETYVVELQTATDSAFTAAVGLGQRTITRGDIAGSKYVLNFPNDDSCLRYVRLNYTLGGTSPTATVTAFVGRANMIQNNVVYADAITIS